MAASWQQENYFKYAREHFALDALDSYADTPDDLGRLVPNPAKAHAGDQVSVARAQLTAVQGGVADAIDASGVRARQPGSGVKATVDPAAGQVLTAATTDLAAATAASRETLRGTFTVKETMATATPKGKANFASRRRTAASNIGLTAIPSDCTRTTFVAT